MGVDARRIRRQGCGDRGQRGEFFPGHGKFNEVESFNSFCLANHRSHGLAAESGLNFGKHRLVSEFRNHTVAVLAGNIL